MKKIFLFLILIILGLSTNGCFGNRPEPYKVKTIKNSEIKPSLRQTFINKLIDDIANSQNYKSLYGCIEYHNVDYYKDFSRSMDHINTCYKLEYNDIINRTDHLSCSYNGKEKFCNYSKKYLETLMKIQSKDFLQKLKKMEDEWVSFDQKYNQKSKKLEELKNETRIVFNDKTHILSKEFLNKLESKIKLDSYINVSPNDGKNISKYDFGVPKAELTLFFNRGKHNLDNFFIVKPITANRNSPHIIIDNNIFYYDTNPVAIDLTTSDKKIIVNINKIVHNFLPHLFNFGDSNLEISVSNKYSSFDVSEFKVQNKSKKFIELNKLVVYYNGKNLSIALPNNLIIPPMSSKVINSAFECNSRESLNGVCRRRSSYSVSDIDVKNKDIEVEYGFSLEYIYDNHKKNIYDVRKYGFK